MSRYSNTNIIRNIESGKLGPRVYQQTVYKQFEADERDTYFYSREGDRLDSLANEFYGDVTFWWVIASANNLGKGTFSITPGQLIRIPFKRNFEM